jgi:hypothetical protein
VEVGTFKSPLAAERLLRGSYFTQSLMDYLEYHQGQLQPAFNAARTFTASKAREVTAGKQSQVPRYYSTQPADQNNFYQ